MRDEFTQGTKEYIAHRAGYRCSKPDCGTPTRGAASADDGTINLGEAAHITAASPNGPRYDASLTSEQRRHHPNGIWLCGTHAKLVDSDEFHFTVPELRSWKRAAEVRSFNDLVMPGSHAPEVSSHPDLDFLVSLARADLATFQRVPSWPLHAVELSLKIVDEKDSHDFGVSGLAAALDTFEQIAVVAPPGTGKTTTLIQLVAAAAARAALVPVFVPLGEWSTGQDTFLEALTRRASFREVDIRRFEALAEHGSLALVLDGWNELDERAKQRARNDLKALQRNFPDIRLVISSRAKEFDLPISGPVVEVGFLTQVQQLDIARAMRGEDGETLMEHAWRTPGLRELVTVPLYLSVLLTHAKGRFLPTTKEEVLRTFVTEHERDPEKTATLRRELQGFHTRFLIALASESMYRGTATLSDPQARAIVNQVQELLHADRQITLPLQPLNVLDALVSVHLLVRAGATSSGVSFQHQQFQEWYASFWVEDTLRTAATGDARARKTLREDVLNIRLWEEPILFACERMSRSANGAEVRAISDAVLEALGIDPLLSAEMIYRSSEAVWVHVKDRVVSFAEAWHRGSSVDRAVHFMVDTGRPEFSQHIWPLISDPNSQVHLRALRAGRRFRPTVLGDGVLERISGLPEELRAHILSEIARESGMDGIELATALAKADASVNVKFAVVEALQFRRLDRLVAEILLSAPPEIWRLPAERWHPSEFGDAEVSARVEQEAQRLLAEQTDPRAIIRTLLSPQARSKETGAKIGELLQQVDFSDKKQDSSWLIHQTYELYPENVAESLVAQIEKGRPVPFRSEDWLRSSKIVVDGGPLVQRVLHATDGDHGATAAVSVFGSKAVGELIDRLSEIDARLKATRGNYDKGLSDQYHQLKRSIANSRIASFTHAVLERSRLDDPDKIAFLADLISRHGREIPHHRLRLDAATHERVTETVRQWAEQLLASPGATRMQFAEIAEAAQRLESEALVPALEKLLAEDLARRQRAMDQFLTARQNGRHITNDARTSWSTQYQRAFVAIGDAQSVALMKAYLPHREFGIHAAHALHAIWQKSQPAADNERAGLRGYPDFSVVKSEYAKRKSRTQKTIQFVDDILAIVSDVMGRESQGEDHRHALRLAAVAFRMPHLDKEEMIAALLRLPRPPAEKQELLIALVLSGECIPSDAVMQGIDRLLEEAQTNPWILEEQDGWRLSSWLELLPFTERVDAVLDVLDRLQERHKLPWHFRRLLSALGDSPSSASEHVLGELPKLDVRFLLQHDWRAALTGRNTLSAARVLLDCVDAAIPTKSTQGDFDFSSELVALVNSHAEFRVDVYKRFQALPDGRAKSVIARSIADVADAQGVLLLVRDASARGKSFRQTALYTALRHALVGQRPSASWPGMEEMYSVPALGLRNELFALVLDGTPSESELAAACLTAIDEMRDDYGEAESEPRHPDITRGMPWPRVRER